MVAKKPVEDCFDYILNHGISHLEIDLNKPHSELSTFTPRRIALLHKFARENDITLSLHPPFHMNLCSRVPLVRNRHARYIKKCIRFAHAVGAGHLTLHMGNFYKYAIWAHPWENAIARLLKLLKNVLPYCEKYGIRLALENMVPVPAEIGYRFLGDNVTDFQRIFSGLESQYLQFCLDIGHAHIGGGPLPFIEKLGVKLTCVHFHDNKGEYDDHLDVGAGSVDWEEILKALENIHFTGPFISECFNSLPHDAIARLLAIKKAIN